VAVLLEVVAEAQVVALLVVVAQSAYRQLAEALAEKPAPLHQVQLAIDPLWLVLLRLGL
tara:strand:+ start:1889 stop:2065 length:177 start_codon:yes stop_codon:yes gene_type:complete